MSAPSQSTASRKHRLPLEPHALYLLAFSPLHRPISYSTWFLAIALPMRDPSTNQPMKETQWMYTYSLEHGRGRGRDTYSPTGGTLEEVNNVLLYRLTPPHRRASPDLDPRPDDLLLAGSAVDLRELGETEEKDWLGKLFIWRVILELKRRGKVGVSDLGGLWSEIVQMVGRGVGERERGGREPVVGQCGFTY